MTWIAVARGNFSLRTWVTLSSPSVWEANIRCAQCHRGSCKNTEEVRATVRRHSDGPCLSRAGPILGLLVSAAAEGTTITPQTHLNVQGLALLRLPGMYPGSRWHVYVCEAAHVYMFLGVREQTQLSFSGISPWLFEAGALTGLELIK